MANNSKIDAQMDRIQYLMGYRVPVNESKRSNKVECHMLGADNKVYGILKEGSMYYIMTTEQGKEKLAESYEYIGGYNYRNENGYNSYNEATKQLEMKLISLNEAYNKHQDVSIADTNRGKKNLAVLTEEARKELDRIHKIYENSQVIGKNNTGDPESKGKATDPSKQGDPFEETAKAELDKDFKDTTTVEGATDNTKVEGVDKDLESDANKTKKVNTAEQPKDTHDDLEGEGVADQHPKGGKVVMVNEDVDNLVGADDEEVNNDEIDLDSEINGLLDDEEPVDNVDVNIEDTVNAPEGEEVVDTNLEDTFEEPFEDETDFDTLLEEFEETEKAMHGEDKNIESKIEGPDKVMDGPHGGLKAQSWDKMNESIDRITEAVVNKLCGKKKKETLKEAVDRIIKEEITNLNAWGKHPRYQKPAFQTPDNHEVSVNGSEDWNDDSTKGSEAYGKKIGKGDPFEKAVNLVLDNIKKTLSEGKKSKKA